jgi:hypothetical protein
MSAASTAAPEIFACIIFNNVQFSILYNGFANSYSYSGNRFIKSFKKLLKEELPDMTIRYIF